MANFSNLKTAIENAVDWNNGDHEITGQNLLDILETIIDSLGAKYKFADVATPSSSITTPDEPLFYLAGAGTYTNFSGLSVTIPRGTLAIFYYDTAWHYTTVRTDSDAFFNVNQYLGAPSATYTKANARNAVPEALRSKGMIITYLTTNGWIIEQNLSTSGTWNADANWQTIGPVSVSQNISTGGFDLSVGSDTYNIADQDELSEVSKEDTSGDDNIIIETDAGEQIAKLSRNEQNFKNLKKDGHPVLTENDVDNVPASGSNKVVKSGGVYAAISESTDTIEDTISEIDKNNGDGEESVEITDDDGNVIAKLSNTTQNFKNLKKDGQDVLTEEMLNTGLKQVINKPNSKTILYVKKNGTGDFLTPQEAINSITDASISNQYEVRICDDYESNDLTDLWQVTNPLVKNTSALTPTTFVTMIVTKDYVDVVGWNRQRKISIHSPNNITPSSMQYVTALHLTGTCRVENLIFEVKNARYAIHQEGSFPALFDENCITYMKNVTAIHLGNDDSSDASAWTATCAQANGAASGMNLIYENVKWLSKNPTAFYMHGNKNFAVPFKVTLKGCSANKLWGLYIGTNGSGHKTEVYAERCNLPKLPVNLGIMTGNVVTDECHDIRTIIPYYNGMGNCKMVLGHWDFTLCDDVSYIHTLAFKTSNVNKNVKVVGGTAKALIYGEDLLYYDGTTDMKGFVCGTETLAKATNTYGLMLANRLGDCSVTNKTLIVEVDGVQQTITFDKNYIYDGDSNTTYTDSYIIEEINEQLEGAECVINEDKHQICYTFDDCKEYACNKSSDTIMPFMPVKRINTSPFGLGWGICPANEVPDGIACERINPDDYGNVAIIDKCSFDRLYGLPESGAGSLSQNTYYKVSNNGTFVSTTQSDGVLWCNNNHYVYKVTK